MANAFASIAQSPIPSNVFQTFQTLCSGRAERRGLPWIFPISWCGVFAQGVPPAWNALPYRLEHFDLVIV